MAVVKCPCMEGILGPGAGGQSMRTDGLWGRGLGTHRPLEVLTLTGCLETGSRTSEEKASSSEEELVS